jgi:hypothetical protein
MATGRSKGKQAKHRIKSTRHADPGKGESDPVPPSVLRLKPGPREILAGEFAITSPALDENRLALKPARPEVSAVRFTFKDTIRVINEMLASGIISRYAVGGAVGATFYLEPVRTVDVDIFVPIHPQAGRLIVTLDPIADHLRSRGYSMQDEYWAIEGSLVSFLTVEGDDLLLDAISDPRRFEVEGVPVFVFAPEYLAAIALKVARPEKDMPRLQQFIRERKVDEVRFLEILKRHNLLESWSRFKAKYAPER